MRNLTPCLFAAALTSVAAAQSFLYLPASGAPATSELNSYRIVPFMRSAARVQMFYDAGEVGASTFTATSASLRYDGPIPPVGASGPFSIQRVKVEVGSTTVAIPGPEFARNLSQPLTTAFDGTLTYWPDQGTSGPEPWGGPNDKLTFAFAQPVVVTIPPGGFLVVQLSIEGNDSGGQAHTMLDAARGGGGAVDGFAVSSGSGCSAAQGQPDASIETSGVHAPGGVHSIHGTNLGANAPVFALLGVSDRNASFGALPFPVPGTACSLYTSWDLTLPGVLADASGAIAPFARGTTVALPAVPQLSGGALYEQLVSYVPGANPWGLVFSDLRTVVLGQLVPPSPGFYAVSHGFSATAPVADDAGPYGYALRLQVQ